jgi:hypothetical protein
MESGWRKVPREIGAVDPISGQGGYFLVGSDAGGPPLRQATSPR